MKTPNRDYLDTYDSVLTEIFAGREATAEQLAAAQRGAGGAYGRELREFHESVQSADTSKPGWISRLLEG